VVQVKEQLQCGEVEKCWTPAGGDLDSAEIIGAFVSRRSNEVKRQTIMRQLQKLGHQSMLQIKY